MVAIQPTNISSTRQAINQTMALVLAGGRGSRLMQLTDNRAKPAVHASIVSAEGRGNVRATIVPLERPVSRNNFV